MSDGTTEFNGFPSQKKTKAQKTKSWAKQCISAADSKGFYQYEGLRNYRKNKLINYNLYNGIVDKRDIELTINPYNTVAAYVPDELPHYPIAAPKIDLLVGEEAKRRFDFKVVVTNPDAISEKEEALRQQWQEKLLEVINDPDLTQEEVQARLVKHESYLKQSWQDIKEKTANNILRHYYAEHNMQLMFNQGFKDSLICGEEIYQTDIVADEPVIHKLNPLNVHVIRSGGSNWIQDSDLIIIEDYWNPGKVVDNFFEELKSTDIDRIEKGFAYQGSSDKHTGAIEQQPDLFVAKTFTEDYVNMSEEYGHNYGKITDTNGNIRVLKVYWKSFRKVQKVTYFDEDGEEQVDIFPEDYEINPDLGETSKTLWINEWWEGTKIGEDIYIQMRPRPIQYNRIDNPSKCSPGIVGYIYSTNQFKSVSMMDRMKQYQYLYDAMKDRLNRALAKYLGPLLELDLSKVPENWEIGKWMHFAVANGIAVVDSFKEGNKGASTGKLAGANNTSGKVLNVELGNYIQQHISMLEYIKSDMSEIVGISKQREGQISSRETVGGVERSVNQSSHITEERFLQHEVVKVEVLKAFLETAKHALRNKSKKVQYILGDESIQILNIDGNEFVDADYGILVSMNNKYQELNQVLRELAHAGIQNDKMDFSTLISIYMDESLSTIAAKIREKEEEKSQTDAQRFEQEQQVRQAEIQQKEQESLRKEQGEETRNIRDNQTKLEIAMVKLQEAMDNGEVDNDGLEVQKHKDDIMIKIKELQQDMEKHKDEMRLKEKEIQVKKSQASKPKS